MSDSLEIDASSTPSIAVVDGQGGTKSPTMEQLDGTPLERTLAIIKPNVIGRADEIAELIEENGFTILRVRSVEEATELDWESCERLTGFIALLCRRTKLLKHC